MFIVCVAHNHLYFVNCIVIPYVSYDNTTTNHYAQGVSLLLQSFFTASAIGPLLCSGESREKASYIQYLMD